MKGKGIGKVLHKPINGKIVKIVGCVRRVGAKIRFAWNQIVWQKRVLVVIEPSYMDKCMYSFIHVSFD